MNDIECKALKRVLTGMKRNELSRFTISPDFGKEEEDEEGLAMLFEGVESWQKTNNFVMEIRLHDIIKVEDWYGDQSTMMRKLRRGKGRNPYTDSTIWFRMKIDVNGEEKFSNYPDTGKSAEEIENLRDMTPEEREQLL